MALTDQDPALSQEDVEATDAGVNTITDPLVEEGAESANDAEAPEAEKAEGEGSSDKAKATREDQIDIVVDGEEPPASKEPAPAWVKDLRKEHRELKARNAELERTLAAQDLQQKSAADPGPKPTLENCDFDSEVFEKKLESWHDGRRRKEAADTQAAQQADMHRRAWQSKLDAYARSKEELSKQIPDYSEAENTVQGLLDVTQQGIILQGSKNAALVIAALGQNPRLAKELADTKDPIAFAFMVANLEGRLKTQKKTQAPPPEKPVRGTGPVSGSADSQLERLRTEAAKTGDFSKVAEYNRQKKARK